MFKIEKANTHTIVGGLCTGSRIALPTTHKQFQSHAHPLLKPYEKFLNRRIPESEVPGVQAFLDTLVPPTPKIEVVDDGSGFYLSGVRDRKLWFFGNSLVDKVASYLPDHAKRYAALGLLKHGTHTVEYANKVLAEIQKPVVVTIGDYMITRNDYGFLHVDGPGEWEWDEDFRETEVVDKSNSVTNALSEAKPNLLSEVIEIVLREVSK